jgi:hypothetical protein
MTTGYVNLTYSPHTLLQCSEKYFQIVVFWAVKLFSLLSCCSNALGVCFGVPWFESQSGH